MPIVKARINFKPLWRWKWEINRFLPPEGEGSHAVKQNNGALELN
jgi:hypothetical protein